MMVTTVRGRFKEYAGQVETEDDAPTTPVDNATIKPLSLDTGVEQRDQHLRSGDFFDVERYPETTYASTKVERVGSNRYRVSGDLTIKGQTRPVTLEAEVEEPLTDPWGNERRGRHAQGTS